jgi:hypothetical protein
MGRGQWPYKERQVIVFRYLILLAALATGCVAADAAESRRIVRRGPLGLRREVVIERGPQAIRLPRQQAIILPHSQSLVVPQSIVVPHSFGAQQLIIVR